jgi:hypothetical protein
MKAFGFAWAGGLLFGCCLLGTQAFAQNATTVNVVDIVGQPVHDVGLYFESNGVNRKAQGDGGTMFLYDLGSKVAFHVESEVYGNHDADIVLNGGLGKYEIDLVLTGSEMLTKMRTVDTSQHVPLSGLKTGGVAVGVNGDNLCSNASAIAGQGSFAFDNTGATTDGATHVAPCVFFGSGTMSADIWYAWTADADGNALIDTCGSSIDTKLNAYNDVACPPGDADILACNDDFCSLQSGISFAVTTGTTYLLRLGGFNAAAQGAGSLNITIGGGGGGGGCTTATFCQNPDLVNGFTSNDVGSIFTVADNFSPIASGSITDVCWWGVGFDGFGDCSALMSDNFTITYYNDDANGICPGTLKAGPFPVVGSRTATGNLLLGVFTELLWSASHAPVAVNAGECCWIEIKNGDSGCFFAWESSVDGDGRSCQTDVTVGAGSNPGEDVAFCLNVDYDNTNCDIVGPSNDLCADATAIAGQGTFAFDNTAANTDGPAHAVCDFFADGGNTDHDVWYCWTSDCTGDVRFETCGLTGVDTKLNVYDNCTTASDVTLIACNDDDCGFQSGLIFAATAGNSYKLRVGTFPTAAGGAGNFSLACVSVPANDLCQDAIAVGVPSTTSGTTSFSTFDAGTPTCGTTVTTAGVWYTVTGTGNTMTASTCSAGTNYDTKLGVYCGNCANLAGLTCVTGNDDFCGLQSQVSWCSQSGATYLILVHGFGGATGNFDLILSDNGQSCSGAIACVTAGACCVGVDYESCVEVTAGDCAALGGVYQGDNTVCGGYNGSSCANAFQDITGSGTALVLGDDTGASGIALGFSFDFFGTSHSSIAVCSNGYLTFGTTLTDFTEDPIPTAATPNDIICPMWDDLSPNAGGTVHYQTSGPAGNQVFVAQWTNVPQYPASGSNTFEALLFEVDNHVEFRYGTLDAGLDGVADGRIGLENATGTDGIQWNTAVHAGDCVAFSLSLSCPPPECHLAFGTSMGTDTFQQGGHLWNTQLDNVYATYSVWLDDIPTFQIPPFTNFPIRWANLRNLLMADVPFQQYSVQVVMWNPEVFPQNPEQYSGVLNVTVWLSGRVDVTPAGSSDNMGISYEVTNIGGYNYLRFPFTINGF